ncbi:MAG: tRNA (cytidine(34)-2'-O)-methyltransferase [Lachnospiraceae bacterium]|nr:tRNA (cytidine(34)-2'-O)-methyltransferase [Lachnospiraceae bacterium]
MSANIVLLEPEIASNTGNIGRTCLATGSRLHLIEPLGFHLDDRNLKRAGMDYWKEVDVSRYINYKDFLQKNGHPRVFLASTKAKRSYTDVEFGEAPFIMFGREGGGIPEEILVEHEEECIRIPMLSDIRSLNLANSVAIVLYEALRQQGFKGFQREGELHELKWK